MDNISIHGFGIKMSYSSIGALTSIVEVHIKIPDNGYLNGFCLSFLFGNLDTHLNMISNDLGKLWRGWGKIIFHAKLHR